MSARTKKPTNETRGTGGHCTTCGTPWDDCHERLQQLAEALRRMSVHLCCHPPMCGHGKFSECRDALVTAILKETKEATP